MKKTYLMLLLALAGLGSSCTNEDGTADVTPSGDPGEIQLVFSGSGEEYFRRAETLAPLTVRTRSAN